MNGKALCSFYIRRAGLIGALYSIVPTVAWFAVLFAAVPFREVYLLRLLLSLSAGGYVAYRANIYGVGLWLARHRGPQGPATVADSAIVGAGVGLAATLLPPLTGLIATNHLEDAKWFIIIAWLVAIVVGATIGAVFGHLGRKHVGRESAS